MIVQQSLIRVFLSILEECLKLLKNQSFCLVAPETEEQVRKKTLMALVQEFRRGILANVAPKFSYLTLTIAKF